MEDAYVIGIRLALDDGVSAGIATISGELASLDAAIATTAVNLERLQELARSIEMPRLPTPSISRSDQGLPPGSPANDPIMALPTPPFGLSQSPPPPERARDGDPVPFAVSPPPAVPRAAAGAPAPTRPPASVGTSVPPPVIRLLAQSTVAAGPPAIAPRSINEPPGLSPPTTAAPPSSNNPPNAPTAPSAASPSATAFVDRDRPSAQPVTPVINVAIAAPIAPISPAPAERGDAESHSRAPSRPETDAVATRHPVAPAVRVAPTATIPRLAASPTYPAASAAPPPRDNQNGPRQGDVYLDGARLGRWIADRLAGDAGGPQSGITGFDARLGATWPGASQGF